MKKILVLALVAIMATVAIVAAQEAVKKPEATTPATTEAAKPAEATKPAAKPVTLTGEVLDLYCYMDHKATGAEHMKCATSCIKKGLPVGFLAADGTVYLVTGKDHEPANAALADFAGKKSAITGTVKEQGGIKAIELVSIAEAK